MPNMCGIPRLQDSVDDRNLNTLYNRNKEKAHGEFGGHD